MGKNGDGNGWAVSAQTTGVGGALVGGACASSAPAPRLAG